MEYTDKICFFLGANTPQGFVSFFDQITNPEKLDKLYVIKGGPGTGKSSLMKKVVKLAEDKNYTVEHIYCSSDPASLDGAIIKNTKTAIADGTAPHVIEPKYPGAFENVINLCQLWDGTALYARRKEIMEHFKENKILHERCSRYLAAAASMIADSCRIAQECTNFEKAALFAKKLFTREIKEKSLGSGKEEKRFLSAVTYNGIVFFESTLEKLCDRVYVIEDEYGAVSKYIFNILKQQFIAAGFDIYCGYCPLSPADKIEHIIVPQLKIAFTTQNRYLHIEKNIYRNYHCQRFMDMEKLHQKKYRLRFNKRASKEFLQEAVRLQQCAKRNHDELEKFYIGATDFKANKEFYEQSANTVVK